MKMTPELFQQIVAALSPLMDDAQNRQMLVTGALFGSPVLQHLTWSGPARAFTIQLVQKLDTFGQIAPGRPALLALLEEVRAGVGVDRQAEFDRLIAQLRGAAAPAPVPPPPPPIVQPVAPPPGPTPADALYVFLSYARPDQAVAAQVEAFLTARGVRVFRDTSDIGAGDNWDLKIERALRECQCMVLLLSAASMPERKEVHREWFNFDQKGKKIYPLYLEDCQLHSRFDSRNYLDARMDLPGALQRLWEQLQRDFLSLLAP
jgi:hypothetical protein